MAVMLAAGGATAGPAWVATSDMSLNRVRHTATLLADGRVLIAGGVSPQARVSSEIFDPTNDSWSPAVLLGASRPGGHTATLLGDGHVLVTGCDPNSTPSPAVEIFDPTSGAWAVALPMKATRNSHTATLLADGRVLATGGWSCGDTIDPESWQATTELFDPKTGVWSTRAPMSIARVGHAAALLADGRVLVMGGRRVPQSNGVTVFEKTAEIWDPATDTWSPAGAMSVTRDSFTAIRLLDGRVLVVGGREKSAWKGLARAELYDPATNTWSPAAPMSRGRVDHTATLLADGRVLVIGGASDGEAFQDAEVYDPAANLWSPAGTLMSVRAAHAATLLRDGRVLVTGGSTLTAADASAWLTSAEYTRDRGASCEAGEACLSGFCASGVCCDRACDGSACDVCSKAAGAVDDGVCTTLPKTASAQCAVRCASVHDCPEGLTCSLEGVCTARVVGSTDASGCAAAQRGGDSSGDWIALAGLAVLAARRARRSR